MGSRNYYDVLGVSRGAADDEIKKAYRRKARALHPDQAKDKSRAETEFKEVNEAYDVLKDRQKRQIYDQVGHAAFEAGGSGGAGFSRAGAADFSAFSNVFDEIFGGFREAHARGSSRQRDMRGSDLRYDVTLDLEEAYNGVRKRLTISTAVNCDFCNGLGTKGGIDPGTCPTCSGAGRVRAQQSIFTIEQTCPTCSGTGQVIRDPCRQCAGAGRVAKDQTIDVDIPPGVDNGSRIRLGGRGEAGQRGGHPGDLYVFVNVRDHSLFEREGKDLYCRIPVSMPTAALGGEIEVPTVSGDRASIRIPAGSQSGRRMRLGGKGMPQPRGGGGKGDMYVDLFVETPVNLTNEQRKLLERFQQLSGRSNSPQESSFGGKVKSFWKDLKN